MRQFDVIQKKVGYLPTICHNTKCLVERNRDLNIN